MSIVKNMDKLTILEIFFYDNFGKNMPKQSNLLEKIRLIQKKNDQKTIFNVKLRIAFGIGSFIY